MPLQALCKLDSDMILGQFHTCVSTRACSIRVRESAERPLLAQAIWVSISAILSMLRGSCSFQSAVLHIHLSRK